MQIHTAEKMMSHPDHLQDYDDSARWWAEVGIYEQLYREYEELKPDMSFEEFCEQHRNAR